MYQVIRIGGSHLYQLSHPEGALSPVSFLGKFKILYKSFCFSFESVVAMTASETSLIWRKIWFSFINIFIIVGHLSLCELNMFSGSSHLQFSQGKCFQMRNTYLGLYRGYCYVSYKCWKIHNHGYYYTLLWEI